MSAHEDIEQRIRRSVSGGSVVPGSTPVVAFDDPTTATVATLGLNPSQPCEPLGDTDQGVEVVARGPQEAGSGPWAPELTHGRDLGDGLGIN